MNISELRKLIRDPKCVFISNHSGGKDSQIMYLRLRKVIPKERLIVIHAHLPEVEWDGTEEFIRETVDHEVLVVQNENKTFFEMVEHRGMFPSPSHRQCTSDLKRNPIAKEIRRICNERGFDKVVNCMGLRAQESAARKKRPIWKLNKGNTNSVRTWYDWSPIHTKSEDYVFAGIKSEGQEPFWVYAAGMSRKGCCFCIMASESDLCVAAKLRPELRKKYSYWERKTGQVMMMPDKKKGKRTLEEIINQASTTNQA